MWTQTTYIPFPGARDVYYLWLTTQSSDSTQVIVVIHMLYMHVITHILAPVHILILINDQWKEIDNNNWFSLIWRRAQLGAIG